MNDIKMKVGAENAVISKYLKTLMDLGIVKKETPITEKPGKKTIYMLADNFFDFGIVLCRLIRVPLTPAESQRHIHMPFGSIFRTIWG